MKNNLIKITYILMLITLVSACSSKHLDESEKTVKIFFDALKEGDIEGMTKKYKNIILFDSYYKSDSIKVLNLKKVNDSVVKVNIQNFFTNGFGKLNNQEIVFFVSADSVKSFTNIIDSKGLTNHTENDLYDFSKKIGCLKNTDTSDVQINLKLLNAKIIANKIQTETLLYFIENIKVVDWSWESGYEGSASGKGIVKNNTEFSIPNVKYIIKYMDRNGNVLNTDDGYVSYNKIEYGESKSFTFYTSYVGNAYRASISLDFDKEIIEKYVVNTKEYSGDECKNL